MRVLNGRRHRRIFCSNENVDIPYFYKIWVTWFYEFINLFKLHTLDLCNSLHVSYILIKNMMLLMNFPGEPNYLHHFILLSSYL